MDNERLAEFLQKSPINLAKPKISWHNDFLASGRVKMLKEVKSFEERVFEFFTLSVIPTRNKIEGCHIISWMMS